MCWRQSHAAHKLYSYAVPHPATCPDDWPLFSSCVWTCQMSLYSSPSLTSFVAIKSTHFTIVMFCLLSIVAYPIRPLWHVVCATRYVRVNRFLHNVGPVICNFQVEPPDVPPLPLACVQYYYKMSIWRSYIRLLRWDGHRGTSKWESLVKILRFGTPAKKFARFLKTLFRGTG